jgi:hypothetical protein
MRLVDACHRHGRRLRLGRPGAALAREGRASSSPTWTARGEETVAAIRAEGREARFVRADVGKPAEAKALIDETVAPTAVWTSSTTTRDRPDPGATASRRP